MRVSREHREWFYDWVVSLWIVWYFVFGLAALGLIALWRWAF